MLDMLTYMLNMCIKGYLPIPMGGIVPHTTKQFSNTI